eukprot:s2279_g6.t1
MASASSGESWSWALASFAQLVDEALQPSETSYGCVANACEKGQRWSHAILVFADFASDLASCNAAMMACAASGQWQEALGLMELCNGCNGMDIIGIRAAIHACGRAAASLPVMSLLSLAQGLTVATLEPAIGAVKRFDARKGRN